MGTKKIARPINNVKNLFIKWLKVKKAEDIDEYEGEESEEWDYYRHVSAFIGNTLYSVHFMMWNGEVEIDYSDGDNRYNAMGVDEFLQLIA